MQETAAFKGGEKRGERKKNGEKVHSIKTENEENKRGKRLSLYEAQGT